MLAALEAGVESFESSFGELGGCPVPAGATGNIATEDLVSMLHEMGIATGVDLPALLACARARAGGPRPPARQPHARRRAGRLAPVTVPSAADRRAALPRERLLDLARALARGGHAVLLDGDLHLERLRERRAGRGVDHALGAADGDRRVGEQLVDERLRRRLELARARRRG